MRNISIRKRAINEEVDYLFLKSILQSYRYPRAKITSLLRSKVLIRVKKGLYIFGPEYAEKPYVKEALANLIYGPSYISLEYALAFYGFIPERVETFTSVTNKKDKQFKTPVGLFTYRYLHPNKYSVGVTQIMIDSTHPILIATPEKALVDKIMLSSPGLHLNNIKELEEFMFEDLRVPPNKINVLDGVLLNKIADIYQDDNVTFLSANLTRLRKKHG